MLFSSSDGPMGVGMLTIYYTEDKKGGLKRNVSKGDCEFEKDDVMSCWVITPAPSASAAQSASARSTKRKVELDVDEEDPEPEGGEEDEEEGGG